MIYKKNLAISSATNKLFAQGEIVTFVQVDAQKMNMLSYCVPTILTLPVTLIVCFVALFFYLKWPFIFGMITFVIVGFVQTNLSRYMSKFQKMYMKK